MGLPASAYAARRNVAMVRTTDLGKLDNGATSTGTTGLPSGVSFPRARCVRLRW
jgi:hypothetical protein